MSPPELIARARRITVKIGSSLLIDANGLRLAWLAGVAADIAMLRAEGRHVVVVCSGAVALGRHALGMKRSARLELKQAAAAAGQPLLMAAWGRALQPHGIVPAQLLLTYDDTEQRRRWLNARATFEALLEEGALPIVNENDTVATEELRFGDNDRLSARAAQLIQSDVLVLLSDVDGLYTADPAQDNAAQHIPIVSAITPDVEVLAGGTRADGVGTGGMRTKLAAADIAGRFGCTTIIASGRTDRPLASLCAGARATIFPASDSPASAYKRWIAGMLAPAGALVIDDGAVTALRGGKSLLPAGVLAVAGDFARGGCVRIEDARRVEIARGIAAYDAADARIVLGCRSDEIERRLGYPAGALVHRDDMVLR